MSRLIDADALIEVIKESRPLNWTDSDSELQEDADYNHFIEMVNAQPTAYDVEKVVAELEEQKQKADEEYKESFELYHAEFWRGRKGGLRKAIEIVRKGGAT